MKKIFVMLSILIFTAAVFVYAADVVKPELRPAQKLMQARAAWLSEISRNLGNNNFEAISNDAN